MAQILFLTLCLSTLCLIVCADTFIHLERTEFEVTKGEQVRLTLLISPPLHEEAEFEINLDNHLLSSSDTKLGAPTANYVWMTYNFVVSPSDDSTIENNVQSYTIDINTDRVGVTGVVLDAIKLPAGYHFSSRENYALVAIRPAEENNLI